MRFEIYIRISNVTLKFNVVYKYRRFFSKLNFNIKQNEKSKSHDNYYFPY